jgi:hypothetical protein
LLITEADIQKYVLDSPSTLIVKDVGVFLMNNINSKTSAEVGVLGLIHHSETGIEYKELFIYDIEQAILLRDRLSSILNVGDTSEPDF